MPAHDWRGSLPLGLRIFCCTGRATGNKPLALHTKTASRVATKTEVRKWALNLFIGQNPTVLEFQVEIYEGLQSSHVFAVAQRQSVLIECLVCKL